MDAEPPTTHGEWMIDKFPGAFVRFKKKARRNDSENLEGLRPTTEMSFWVLTSGPRWKHQENKLGKKSFPTHNLQKVIICFKKKVT